MAADMPKIFEPKCALRRQQLQRVPGLFEAMHDTRRLMPSDLPPLAKRQWREQLYVNAPLLVVASLLLYQFAARRGCTNFLFATRDCAHWRKIFARLFPHCTVHYFGCSRVMFTKAREHRGFHPYDAYVEQVLLAAPGLDARASKEERLDSAFDKTVFVDIHGCGAHALEYFAAKFSAVPCVYILTSKFAALARTPSICVRTAKLGKLFIQVLGVAGKSIESLNYDLVGTLVDHDGEQEVREAPEYALAHVQPYHDCMAVFASVLREFPEADVTPELGAELVQLMARLAAPVRRLCPIVAANVSHVRHHARRAASRH
jgi:hypothetical protein